MNKKTILIILSIFLIALSILIFTFYCNDFSKDSKDEVISSDSENENKSSSNEITNEAQL